MQQAIQQEKEPQLLREMKDGVCTLILNRPHARNALSDSLIAELHSSLLQIKDDRKARVVVIAARGPAFCAGHDLREMSAKSGIADYRDLFRRCSDLMLAITHLPQPVIAQVQGIATAAGCQLAASCDLAVAGESAKFATPGVNIGLFCSTPMVALSRKVGRKFAMKMLLTGEFVSAESAREAGLINEVAADSELEKRTMEIAAAIAKKSSHVLAIGKEAFYRQVEMPLADAYDYAAEVMAKNMTARDAAEGIGAFLEKRHPQWRDE